MNKAKKLRYRITDAGGPALRRPGARRFSPGARWMGGFVLAWDNKKIRHLSLDT